jgi:CRISPR-associated protein Cmr2
VVSPALIHVQEGMPNRILIQGNLDRNDVANSLAISWKQMLVTCQDWLEQHLDFASEDFCWQAEWEKWQRYTWEIFWGQGSTPNAAMTDLEQRKLKRDWIGINWTGESSSLTGTDAIAWHRLGAPNSEPGRSLNRTETASLKQFYRQLAWVLDNPQQNRAQNLPNDDQLIEGRFVAANERLSIPELVKRLVTYGPIAKQIGMNQLTEGFTEISREPGNWTGWFMGDGDQVGSKLKAIGDDNATQTIFSEAMRTWGKDFKQNFPPDFGRVVYAGGDDFLGVIYNNQSTAKALASQSFEWLKGFKQEWQTHGQTINVSLGFVWAAHRVPQRDILQHCREAEKLAKQRGRDRVTIRIVFNSGQYVQWTTPWACLGLLDRYSARDGSKSWTHLYKDWAYLKSRHAIRVQDVGKCSPDRTLALSLLDLYFEGWQAEIPKWAAVVGDNEDGTIIQWIDDLIQVGWQLCSNI